MHVCAVRDFLIGRLGEVMVRLIHPHRLLSRVGNHENERDIVDGMKRWYGNDRKNSGVVVGVVVVVKNVRM